LTFALLIEQKQIDTINGFDEKSRRITKEKLDTLKEDPYPGKRGDKEKFCLRGGYIFTGCTSGDRGLHFTGFTIKKMSKKCWTL